MNVNELAANNSKKQIVSCETEQLPIKVPSWKNSLEALLSTTSNKLGLSYAVRQK